MTDGATGHTGYSRKTSQVTHSEMEQSFGEEVNIMQAKFTLSFEVDHLVVEDINSGVYYLLRH